MFSQTLLERMSHLSSANGRKLEVNERELMHSIRENLSAILNTVIGSAPAQPDMGIPAPCEILLDYPESMPRLLAAMARSIERYEPRMTNTRVVHVPTDGPVLEIGFKITGRIPALGNKLVGVESYVQQNGQVACRGYRQ